MTQRSSGDRGHADDRGDRRGDGRPEEPGTRAGAWFLSTTLQVVVAVIGLVVVLFALGQAVGVDLLGITAQALSTQTGQWLAVAVIALLAMSAAMRTMRYATAP